MAYDHNEVVWTPGRVHVGNEVETDITAAFTALTNEVQAVDLAPNAKLAPWNFVNGRSVSPFCFHGTQVVIPVGPASTVVLGGRAGVGNMQVLVRECALVVGVAAANNIVGQLEETDEDGVDALVMQLTLPAGQTRVAAAPAGPGTQYAVGRRRTLHVELYAVDGGVTVQSVMFTARCVRYWVA